jgi:hypothetical protein
VGSFLLLGLEPVLGNRGLGGGAGVLTLDLDGHGLVLLQAAGKVALLGGLGGGRGVEGLDLADGVGLLDGGRLIGLELLQVELLNKVGSARDGGCNKAPHLDGSISSRNDSDDGASARSPRKLAEHFGWLDDAQWRNPGGEMGVELLRVL